MTFHNDEDGVVLSKYTVLTVGAVHLWNKGFTTDLLFLIVDNAGDGGEDVDGGAGAETIHHGCRQGASELGVST